MVSPNRMRRLGMSLLVAGGLALLATLPFTFGDGGNRGTDQGGGVVGWLSMAGIALLLAGGGVFGWSVFAGRRAD